MDISAVIPVYNEKDNIKELTNRLYPILREHSDEFEIVYVYQGRDGGKEILKKMQKKFPRIKMKYFPNPIGVGYAFKVGFYMVSGNATHILTLDGDLNHDPSEVPKFIEASKIADIVVGSRYIEFGKFDQMPLIKKKISYFANFIITHIFNMSIKDISSGFRLYNAKVIRDIREELRFKNYEFYPESLIIASRKGYKIREIPITYYKRRYGESKLNLFKTGIGYARLIFKLLLRK